MATPPKLNPVLEWEVALAYLCGVNTGYISQRWDVSEATIRTNIVGRRSHEWHDPLVEFYRQTNSRDRARNAIHLYLIFNRQGEDFPNAHLIDKELDKAVYEAVDENIFAPRTKKLIEETNLERILGVREQPLSPEEKLLQSIFGIEVTYKKTLKLVNPLLQQKLREAYMQDKRVYLNNIYADISNEIYAMLRRGIHPKVQEYAKGIEAERRLNIAQIGKILDEQVGKILGTLIPREEKVLRMRLGIGYEGDHTLEEVAQDFAVTRERIRQIEAKALRKLRHPSRSRKLRGFLELT